MTCVTVEVVADLPKTQAEAQAAGSKFYNTGDRCRRGHLSDRYTSTRQCVECLRNWTVEWREANPGRVEMTSEFWRQENRDHVNALSRTRYAETEEGEKSRARIRDWRKRNPEKVRLQTRKRRARISGNGGNHTVEDINNLMQSQTGKCAECKRSIRKKFKVDHIMPLSLGGTDDRANLQLLCPTCNRRKWARDPFEWARLNGRLI